MGTKLICECFFLTIVFNTLNILFGVYMYIEKIHCLNKKSTINIFMDIFGLLFLSCDKCARVFLASEMFRDDRVLAGLGTLSLRGPLTCALQT